MPRKQSIYNWPRFWCLRGQEATLDDEGFVADPLISRPMYYSKPNVEPFTALDRFRHLVFLGQPGIGKSKALVEAYETAANVARSTSNDALYINLNGESGEARIHQLIFENQQFQHWLNGSHTLDLFLDSLDECLLRLETLDFILARDFKDHLRDPHTKSSKHNVSDGAIQSNAAINLLSQGPYTPPISHQELQDTESESLKIPRYRRIRLRIACRTSDWQINFRKLEAALYELTEDENSDDENAVGIYELAGLRRIDVLEAARVEGLNPEQFLTQVIEVRAVPLAIKPKTLIFLLFEAKQGIGTLSSSQFELYKNGCRLECEAVENDRLLKSNARDSGLILAVAARVASIMMFGSKSAISTDKNFGDRPSTVIPISQLMGDSESFSGQKIEVTTGLIRHEILETALFTSAGKDHMTWAHQTYAEFLAAWHLVDRGLGVTQVLDLILHPDDPERRVVPQLREVAAWLATMLPDVREYLLEQDPETLLRSDVASFSETERESLIVTLLQRIAKGSRLSNELNYKRLVYPGIGDLLKSYLTDQNRSLEVRQVVARLIETFELHELEGDLLSIALDTNEPYSLRHDILYILKRFGSNKIQVRLRPLLNTSSALDPQDEIRALTISMLFPKHLNALDLFSHLTQPRMHDLVGAYRSLLDHGDNRQRPSIWDQLDLEGIRLGLIWAAPTATWRWAGQEYRGAGKGIAYLVERAWEHLDHPGMLEAIGDFIRARIDDRITVHHDVRFTHDSDFGKRVIADSTQRHLILDYLIGRANLLEDNFHDLYYQGIGGISLLNNDFIWILEKEKTERSKRIKLRWAGLALECFQREGHSFDPDCRNALGEALERSSVMREAFDVILKPILLTSPEATRARESLRTHNKLEAEFKRNQQKAKRQQVKNPKARVLKCLDWVENHIDDWWALPREMTLTPGDTHFGHSTELAVKQLPGWSAANDSTRLRILESAKKYLQDAEVPSLETYLSKGEFLISTFTVNQVLHLLFSEEPQFIENLPTKIWQRWSPIIIGQSVFDSGDNVGEQETNKQIHDKLSRMTYSKAPIEVAQCVREMIRSDARQHDNIMEHHFEHLLDDFLMDSLCTLLEEGNLKPRPYGMLLSTLLEHGSVMAISIATKALQINSNSTVEQRSNAVVCASALLSHTADGAWTMIWPLFKQFPDIGMEIALKHGRGRSSKFGSMASRLTEDAVAELYVWLETQFPRAHDPQYTYGMAHDITPRDSVASWRDDVLSYLVNRGTLTALSALIHIAQRLPQASDWTYVLMQAREITSRKTWKPFEPKQLLEITRNPNSRLIRNNQQLLEVVCESLERLDQRLQGETPVAQFLWNEREDGKYQPKLEERLSDFVKWHLDLDLKGSGLILNREVDIRPVGDGNAGERIDIVVDINVPGIGDRVERIGIIIEVKGCWNPELKTAMETQLVGRYLADNPIRAGLFLVGWYMCPQWDKKDSKYIKAPKRLDLEKARAFFKAQAVNLSISGRHVAAYVLNTALR
jgi:hypothetical protein